MNRPLHSEIGRELRVSELTPRTIVWLHEGNTYATMWLVEVGDVYVWFHAGETGMEFFAMRCGPDLNEICDDTRARIQLCEYLGKP